MIASVLGYFPWWSYVLLLGGGVGVAAWLGFLPIVVGLVKTVNSMLGIIPPIILALGLVFAVATAAVERTQLINLRKEVKLEKQQREAQAAIDKFKQLERAAEATKKLQDEKNARIETANKIAAKAVLDSRVLGTTVIGLRDTINKLNGADVSLYTNEKLRNDASVARELLGICSSRYSELAKTTIGYYTDSIRN